MQILRHKVDNMQNDKQMTLLIIWMLFFLISNNSFDLFAESRLAFHDASI